jgi:hypothetical protein
MATPVERTDYLDLHLNPPIKQSPQQLPGDLDILRKQVSEPASGVHDFSGIKKPTDIDIDSVTAFESNKKTEASDGNSTAEDIKEEIFPLSGEVVSYIYSLSENVPKKALLHDMEDRPKTAITRVLASYYKRNRLTEGEYNKILDLIDGKTDEDKSNDMDWPPKDEDIEAVQMFEMKNQDPEDSNKKEEISRVVDDATQSVGEVAGDLEEENTESSLADSPDKKYKDQVMKDIEEGYFEVARNSAENITDPERKASLIRLINEKEKEENLLNEQSHSSIDNPETTEIIKTGLDIARENYARAKIEFNKKNTKYNKIKDSLQGLLSGGILSGRSKEKSPTEIELEEARVSLDEAMAAYITEKKIKKDEIIDTFESKAQEKEGGGVALTQEEEGEMIGQIKIKLLEQAEKEWDLLQGKMAELSLPEGEKVNKIKEVMAKGLKVWSRVPMGARLLLAPILIGTGVGLTAGLGAGALYAGTRLGRGLGGMAGFRIAGSLYDKRADRINAEAKEETASGYENLEKSFEEREADYMKAKEEEVKRKNSQRIKKAMVMVGAGAGAGILTGLAESALSSGEAVRAAGSVETVNKPKLSVSPKTSSFDGVIKPKTTQASVLEAVSDKKEVGTSGLDVVKAPVETSSIPMAVELSPKGFLKDIHTLKARIIQEYGDNIPTEIKTNIIDKPTVEIAKEYGLYKPGDVNESAIGYAGEKLSLDSNGHLIIERVDGTKEMLSGLGREGVKAALPEVDTNTPSVPTPEKLADVPVDTAVIGNKVMPEWDSRNVAVEHAIIPDEPKIIPTVDTTGPENLVYQIPHKNSLVDVVTNNGEKVVKIGDLAIAHEKVFGGGKMLMLDDIYQDGPKYKDIREAFALAFEKSANVDQIGQNPTAIEFEGGKIYIVQGLKNDPMGMKVLLNGKEIASGSMEVKGSVLGPKLKFDSSLKGGWFLDDNAYERAFKNVKKFLQIK